MTLGPPDQRQGSESGATSSNTGGVFLSWTRADTDRSGPLGQIVDTLRSAGVPVWIDDGEIGPFDGIPDAVRDGLSQAKVLLAWYSHAYPTRRACREELTLALLAAENLGQGDRRVLVVNSESGLDHVLEAQLLDRRFATAEDLQDPSALAGRIAGRVGEVAGRCGARSVPGRVRWYGGAGWESGSRRFVGRLAELWKLHDLLQRSTGLAGPGQAGRAVALVSGFGGVGKSLLAAEYAHTFAGCYPGGIWLSALGHDAGGGALTGEQSQAAADSQPTQLARSPSLDVTGLDPTTIRERSSPNLDRRGQPVLWIADDLPTGLDAAGFDAWRCPAGHGARAAHHTLTSSNSLVVAYRPVGRLAEALPLLERTLTDFERVRGPDHPDTLPSRNRLAGAYQ